MGRPGAGRGGGGALHDDDLASRGCWPSRRRAGWWRRSPCGRWSGAGPARADAAHPDRDVRRAGGGGTGRGRRARAAPRPLDVAAHRHRAQPGRRGRPHGHRGLRRPAARLRVHRARDARPCRGPTASAASATRSPTASTSSSTATRGRSGTQMIEAARRSAAPRGSRSRTVPPRWRYWYRLDDPPIGDDGSRRRGRHRSCCATPCPVRSARRSAPTRASGSRRASTSRSTCFRPAPAGLAPRPPARPAMPATATPASSSPSGTRSGPTLVAYATQVMLFTFA